MQTTTSTDNTITIGTRVRVNDPTWYRHGAVGTVVKVNRRTVRTRLDGDPTDIIGSPVYLAVIDALKSR